MTLGDRNQRRPQREPSRLSAETISAFVVNPMRRDRERLGGVLVREDCYPTRRRMSQMRGGGGSRAALLASPPPRWPRRNLHKRAPNGLQRHDKAADIGSYPERDVDFPTPPTGSAIDASQVGPPARLVSREKPTVSEWLVAEERPKPEKHGRGPSGRKAVPPWGERNKKVAVYSVASRELRPAAPRLDVPILQMEVVSVASFVGRDAHLRAQADR